MVSPRAPGATLTALDRGAGFGFLALCACHYFLPFFFGRSFLRVFASAHWRLVCVEARGPASAQYWLTVLPAAFAFLVNAPGCLIAFWMNFSFAMMLSQVERH